MSSWRDDLRRVTLSDGRRMIGASFRGVPFLVETSDRAGGRRTVTHEFPLRDDPFVEDLGRKARTFRVDGYVLGDDYVLQRDGLLAALEDTEGPGELVHPYHGIRRAICTAVSVRESRQDGRIAILEIEFAETPVQAIVPVQATDLAAQVDGSANAALSATDEEFQEGYDIAGMPSFALASASAALTTASQGLGAALAPIASVTQELSALTAQVKLVTAQAASLVRQPANVLAAFTGAIRAIEDSILDAPKEVWRALVDSYGLEFGSVIVTVTGTETRVREAANLAALLAALRRIMIIEAARLMPLITFDHQDDARDAREEVSGLLEEQEATAGDVAYPALVQLRADVSRAVPGDAVLARLITLEQRIAIPSILLAYRLYGSVELEADLIARNRVAHPGFISGDLKVLSNG
jgi:prophage DNA circulation protein